MPLTLLAGKRSQPDSHAVPVVLGVTGHRDLREADKPRLWQAVAAILEAFSRRYRHTPLILLSSLAQGADQLCASVALTQGLQVIAPLPFPAAVYRQSSSFDNDTARYQLDELLGHPRVTSFVAPLPEAHMPADEAGWTGLMEAPDTRQCCYANAGGYVVLHCHALIALWDGEESDAVAGTAQMVQFKRTGRPPEAYPWPQPLLHWADSGPVYVVHTPRASTQATPGTAAGHRVILYPFRPYAEGADTARSRRAAAWQRRAQRQFEAMCRSLNRLNRRLRASPLLPAQDVIIGLLGEDTPPGHVDLSRLALLRDAVSALARRLSARVGRLTVTVFGLIFLAAVCFHLYAHHFQVTAQPPRHTPPYLWAFLVLLLGAYGIVRFVRFRHLEAQALDYRVLAEALRVQIYWMAAGIDASVAASYPPQAHSEISWIQQAVRACSLGVCECRRAFAALSPSTQMAWLSRVGQYWLAGQEDYYHRRHIAHHRAYRKHHSRGLLLAVLGWLLALALAASDFISVRVADYVPDVAWYQDWSAHHPQPWLLVLSGTLVVAGGLSIAYSERRAYEDLARQYNHMGVLFAHSVDALQSFVARGDVASAQGVLLEMGREALTENASWLVLRRARRFELPVH